MAKLRLNLACWNYDRTRALADGSVQPDGIDLNFLDLPVEETFFRMLRYREFEVAELSLSSYTVSLFAEHRTYEDLYMTAALKAMLPWLTSHVEETRALMGDDFWAYGFESNRASLATFLRYHHEQGLSKRLLEPEELFALETMQSFKI